MIKRALTMTVTAVAAVSLLLSGCGDNKSEPTAPPTQAATVPAVATVPATVPKPTTSRFNRPEETVNETTAATESANQARFNEAKEYVKKVIDFSDYKESDESAAASNNACHTTWTNKHYSELTLPLEATVCDYKITLGKTTYKDLLDHGFQYIKSSSQSTEAPYHASFKKDNQFLSCIGNSAASDMDSSVISYFFLYGDDGLTLDNCDPAEFDFNGLTLQDDMTKAYKIFGDPETVEVYSSEQGAHAAIHMNYTISDRTLRISYWYDDKGGTFLNSCEMRYTKL